MLTLVRTEAPFLVFIIVVSSATPQFAVSSPLACTGVILLAQKHKGKVTGLSFRVSSNYSSVWTNKDIRQAVKQINKPLWQDFVGFTPCASFTHHGSDRSHISYPCQSCLWWHTNGIHLCGLLLCSCRTRRPGR